MGNQRVVAVQPTSMPGHPGPQIHQKTLEPYGCRLGSLSMHGCATGRLTSTRQQGGRVSPSHLIFLGAQPCPPPPHAHHSPVMSPLTVALPNLQVICQARPLLSETPTAVSATASLLAAATSLRASDASACMEACSRSLTARRDSYFVFHRIYLQRWCARVVSVCSVRLGSIWLHVFRLLHELLSSPLKIPFHRFENTPFTEHQLALPTYIKSHTKTKLHLGKAIFPSKTSFHKPYLSTRPQRQPCPSPPSAPQPQSPTPRVSAAKTPNTRSQPAGA